MMSAYLASPSFQIDWFTTNSRLGDWYMRTKRELSGKVPKFVPP